MNEEEQLDIAFRMVEVIDYDIAKEFRSDDPEALLRVARRIKEIACGLT